MEASSPIFLDGRGAATIVSLAPSFPPYATSALTAQLVCRVFLAMVANLVCLVPLRLLCRNGEFAAVVFILNVEVKNLDTIVNSLIWRNNDLESWWPGYGLCDVDAYIDNATIGLFITCMLAIMRNLSQQVGLLRANALTVQEKRRRNLVQALIIFPYPLLQLALTWPLTSQRYLVGTLVGCNWIPHASWPFLVFFVLPPPIFALMTAAYALLIYKRFREVTKTTQTALCSNRVAQQRSLRTRRKLYLMVTSILVPFLPIVIALAVVNILEMNGIQSYDYNEIHNHASPLPWNTIMFYQFSQIHWTYMNNCYIPIATAIPIFVFFGMTKDAINSYRLIFLFFGLGKIFGGLHQEYDPDKVVEVGESSFGSNQLRTISSTPLSKNRSSTTSGPSSRQMENGGGPQRPDSDFFMDLEYAPQQDQPPMQDTIPFRHRWKLLLPHSRSKQFRRTKKSTGSIGSGEPLALIPSISPLTRTHHASGPSHFDTLVWAGDDIGAASSGLPGINR